MKLIYSFRPFEKGLTKKKYFVVDNKQLSCLIFILDKNTFFVFVYSLDVYIVVASVILEKQLSL